MTDLLLRMLLGVTFGFVFVLLARKPGRKVFGAAPAFTLWLLPVLLAFAPLLPSPLTPVNLWTMPAVVVGARTAFAQTNVAPDFSWLPILISFWLIGAAAALCRLCVHYVRLLRELAPMPQDWRGMIGSAVPQLDLHRIRVHPADRRCCGHGARGCCCRRISTRVSTTPRGGWCCITR